MFKFIILSLIIIIHDSPSFAQISHQKISNSIAENELAKAAMLAKNDIKAYKHLQEATNLDSSNWRCALDCPLAIFHHYGPWVLNLYLLFCPDIVGFPSNICF